MSKIGSSYFSYLCMLRQAIISLRSGDFQENPEVIVQPCEKGRCCYDGRPSKEVRADKQVLVVYGD